MLNSGKKMIVIYKETGEKLLLLSTSSTDEGDYFLVVDKNGDFVTGSVKRVKFLLSDKQKVMLS